MVTALFKYIKSMGSNTIKKDDISDLLSNIVVNMRTNVIPALESTIKEFKGSNILTKDTVLADIYLSKQYRYVEEMLAEPLSVCKAVVKYDNDLHSLIDNLDNEFYTKGITAEQSYILKIVNDLYTLSTYTLDLSIILLENKGGESEDSIYPKKIKEDKLKYLYDYFSLVIFYKDFRKVVKEKLPDIVLDVDEKDLASVKTLIGNPKVDMPVTGFIGNPIFHLKLYLVDRDVKKIESLKVKKEYLELVILQKEMERDNGTPDPKLEKQIEFYKEEVSKVEHDIEKRSRV